MKMLSYEEMGFKIKVDPFDGEKLNTLFGELSSVVTKSLSPYELEIVSTYLILKDFYRSIENLERDKLYREYQRQNYRYDLLKDYSKPRPKFEYPIVLFPYRMITDYLGQASEINLIELKKNGIIFPNLKTDELKLKPLWEKTLEFQDNLNGSNAFEYKLLNSLLKIKYIFTEVYGGQWNASKPLKDFLVNSFEVNSYFRDLINVYSFYPSDSISQFYKGINKKIKRFKEPTPHSRKEFDYVAPNYITDLNL